MDIKISRSTTLKEKPEKIAFGKDFTDHMFTMDYDETNGWHNSQIIPYGKISFEPSLSALHYGQAIFEGMKAFKGKNGKINLFRPFENAKRVNITNDRMCIPEIDENVFVDSIKALVDIDRDWVPSEPDSSLYLRPFIFASDEEIGLRPSTTYKFMIIMSPASMYFSTKGIKILVEEHFARAFKGGTGTAKTCGNYAGSMKAQKLAAQKGCSQVLWLDAFEKKYIEEVGAMNIFFCIGDSIITPKLNGTILEGITRKSAIELLKQNKYNVIEKDVSIDELMQAHEKGQLHEVFGTGTAVSTAVVGGLVYKDKEIIINNSEMGMITKFLYDEFTSIYYGEKDINNWIVDI